MKEFITYAAARRALELEKRKIESGMDLHDIVYVIQKYRQTHPEWKKVVQDITDWSGRVLDYLVDAGGLGKAESDLIRLLNPIYVPFKRAFLEGESLKISKGLGSFVNMGNAVKKLKGSARPIINPIESLISQTTELILKADKIRVSRALADMAEMKDIGGFIVRVPAPKEARSMSGKKLLGTLKSLVNRKGLMGVIKDPDTGEPLEELDPNLGDLENLDLEELVTFFYQGKQYTGKDNVVSIWRNGQREFYEIHPDLYKALSGMDALKRGPIIGTIGAFARMLRLGATGLRIAFGLARNPFRDAFTYAVFSKRPTATVFDPIAGTYKSLTAKEGSVLWRGKKVGLNLSGMVGFDRASSMNVYDEMMTEKLGKLGKVLKVAKHPVHALQELISITELGPRSVELEGMYKKYRKEYPEWSEMDAWVAAFNDAQDVTVNFTKSGYYAKRINEVAAFFNVAIRGPEKFYRTFRKSPFKTVVRGVGWITLLAMWNWFQNKDKQWYKNIPAAYKYNNYWFEMDDKEVLRLPIPFELGILFASAPMAALDYLETNDPEYLKALKDMVVSQIPDPMPTIAQPIIDVWKNENFLKAPIESEGMQFIPVSERKKVYTLPAAIKLSKALNEMGVKLSPIQVEYLFNQYTGGFIKQLPIRPTLERADIPVIGEMLLRMPENPKRQMNAFFSDYELLQQKKTAGTATNKELQKLNKIKPLYSLFTKKYFKLMARYRDKKDLKRIKKMYSSMTNLLGRYGYD